MVDTRDIGRLFPLVEPSLPAPTEGDPEEDEADIEGRIDEVRKYISWTELGRSSDGVGGGRRVTKPGTQHCRFKSADDLYGPARVFHEKAGKPSAICPPTMCFC